MLVQSIVPSKVQKLKDVKWKTSFADYGVNILDGIYKTVRFIATSHYSYWNVRNLCCCCHRNGCLTMFMFFKVMSILFDKVNDVFDQ